MDDRPAEDLRERQNKLLDKLGNALLGLKAAIEALRADTDTAHAAQLAQGNAHLTQMALVRQQLEDLDKLDQIPALLVAIAEARRDIERVDRSVDDVRRDFTPVHGTPLATREEIDRPESIELGPAKVPLKLAERLGRGLPLIAGGFIIGLAAIIIALWLSGARLLVTDQSPPGRAPVLAPHLVPPLEKPHEP
jgi:hypothetical protein